MNNIGDINKTFKLPIFYCIKKNELDDNIKTDLELIETNTNNEDNLANSNTLYNTVFSPKTKIGKALLESWCDHFTYDKRFLSANQSIFKSVKVTPLKDIDNVHETWLTMKNDTGFLNKYQYVDWEMFEPLNRNSSFLQIMSIYSLTSPVVSLFLPIFLCIVPFFLLKLQKIKITFSTYWDILKKIMLKIPIGQLAYLKNMSWDNRIYTLVSVFFYFFQIYQNILSCYRFYKNQFHIETVLSQYETFINHTVEQIDLYYKESNKHKAFSSFNGQMIFYRERLVKLSRYLEKVKPFKVGFKEMTNIGYCMKHFYEFYKNEEVKDTINYAFGLNAYFDQICGVQSLIVSKQINPCRFSKKKTVFKNAYYPLIQDDNIIKNTYSLKASHIITGPNAAGKTTLLKTTLFNILLSQQIGFGYYKSSTIKLYNHLHCYLNIPDTSGRDSLFQAEARRCKNILDEIENSHKNVKHFCIFDELYSGTNPYEATASALSYLEHLSLQSNVDFMITTHYVELCKKLNRENIKNYYMETIKKGNDNFRYTYLLKEGISDIKGGIKVLRDLGYSENMINKTDKYLVNNL